VGPVSDTQGTYARRSAEERHAGPQSCANLLDRRNAGGSLKMLIDDIFGPEDEESSQGGLSVDQSPVGVGAFPELQGFELTFLGGQREVRLRSDAVKPVDGEGPSSRRRRRRQRR